MAILYKSFFHCTCFALAHSTGTEFVAHWIFLWPHHIFALEFTWLEREIDWLQKGLPSLHQPFATLRWHFASRQLSQMKATTLKCNEVCHTAVPVQLTQKLTHNYLCTSKIWCKIRLLAEPTVSPANHEYEISMMHAACKRFDPLLYMQLHTKSHP